jgi:hypothetical protein
MPENLLPSWKDGGTKQVILDFISGVTKEGSKDFVPQDQRIAVFDNDGTLWCEKPMPIQLDFILRSLASKADQDPALRERQPWNAAHENDHKWLGEAIVKHYRGDNSDLNLIVNGVQQTFGGMNVEDFEAQAKAFLYSANHPTLHRPYRSCTFGPMVELLRCLARHGFTNYIASSGDRDFMRTVTQELYGIPPEQVIGSSFALQYKEDSFGNSVLYKPALDFFDDGPEKPLRIWSRIGRRPILCGGNSNGDNEMLKFTGVPGLPALRLLLLHDDSTREFDYVQGAEKALDLAKTQHWTVISVKNDWTNVFAGSTNGSAAVR